MRISKYGFGALALTHKALGDETRLRIINLLAHLGELCVCDVEAILGISQSKASRHLSYLRNAGLVADRRDGTWVYYRLLRDDSVQKSAIREIKKSLSEEPQAMADLRAADNVARGASCAPVSSSRAASRKR